jgi:hypothetical protein
MAQPTNTHSTYDAIGNREDLGDIIFDVSPSETPFLSAIGKNKATSTKHEWLTRALAAASGTNFVIEGDDATTDAANVNTRVFNYTAISDKVAIVSGTQEAVTKAGMKTNMAREMEDKMKELKRDVETILLQNVAYVAGNDTTARKSAGLQAYVLTNTSKASDATASAGNGSNAHTDGTARALQESFVESVLSSAWTEGGNPTMGVCNAFQKRKFATFSGSSSMNQDGSKKKVVNSVDVYIDPLGTEVRLVPCRQAPTDVVFFVDPEYVKLSTLRNFQTKELAKTGDSERKQILVEYTLEVCNEKSHAAIYDLTAS